MTDRRKNRSLLIMFLELVKDTIVFMNIKLNMAKTEVKRNIGAARKAIILVAAGLFILFLALFAIVVADIAALHTFFPLWLASFLIAAILVAFGAALLLTGKSRLKKSSPVPTKSIARVKDHYNEACRALILP